MRPGVRGGTNLSAAERALFTARRKEAYEALHPETRHGENQHTRSRQVGDSTSKTATVADLSAIPDRFTADTARKTGQSERKVQRDASRGERIAPDVLAKVAGTWQSPAIADGASCGPGRLAFARPRDRPRKGLACPAPPGGGGAGTNGI